MKKIKLPSGAELRIQLPDFDVSQDLFQSVLKEAKGVRLDLNAEADVNLAKDLFFSIMASKEIRSDLWRCFEHCLYDGERITKDTFQPAKAREDYLQVSFEVAKENLAPFMKSLYVEFLPLVQTLLAKLDQT